MNLPLLNWSTTMFLQIFYLLLKHEVVMQRANDSKMGFVDIRGNREITFSFGDTRYMGSIDNYNISIELNPPEITGKWMGCEEYNACVFIKLQNNTDGDPYEINIAALGPDAWGWGFEGNKADHFNKALPLMSRRAIPEQPQHDSCASDEEALLSIDDLFRDLQKSAQS